MPNDDALEAGDDRVVGGDRAVEVFVGVFAARAHALERDRVAVRGVARRVDLDVAAAGGDQLRDHLALDRDDVGQELVHVGIDRARLFVARSAARCGRR